MLFTDFFVNPGLLSERGGGGWQFPKSKAPSGLHAQHDKLNGLGHEIEFKYFDRNGHLHAGLSRNLN
jgi:hypothetical protein